MLQSPTHTWQGRGQDSGRALQKMWQWLLQLYSVARLKSSHGGTLAAVPKQLQSSSVLAEAQLTAERSNLGKKKKKRRIPIDCKAMEIFLRVGKPTLRYFKS